ncbi:palmdelphin isoform X2 [Mastacembelus armatus]|nr:palmdelphin isoform X2 [Mastacembelus armatus]
MDGLSQQSEEEQEAMRLQAQDEQQQSDQLHSNILRIEKEIEALEAQELNITANEEVVLKRLKEVERTAEDIIKEINAEFQADVTQHVPSPLLDIPTFIPLTPAKNPPICKPGSEEPKKATFAMEINVELNKRTGKSQVVSTVPITPETIHEVGLKVYDDGRKSVYALHPDGGKIHNGAVIGMTSTEVDELLRQATDEKVPTEVQYHQPVYSAPYTGSSRPSTPRKTPPSSGPFQSAISSINGAQTLREENQQNQDPEGQKLQSKTPSPILIQQDSMSSVHKSRDATKPCIPGESKRDKHVIPQTHFGAKSPQSISNSKKDTSSLNPALVSVKTRSEGMPAPTPPVYTTVESHSPSLAGPESEVDHGVLIESSGDFKGPWPFYADNITSLNLVNTLPELDSEPVTMIFMGYENADDEEEDIQAELVIIANSDDDDDDDDDDDKTQHIGEDSDGEGYLSYHPEGYKSKVFQPKVGIAKVTGCTNIIEGAYTNWDDLGLHKPTFVHKHGKHSP